MLSTVYPFQPVNREWCGEQRRAKRDSSDNDAAGLSTPRAILTLQLGAITEMITVGLFLCGRSPPFQ